MSETGWFTINRGTHVGTRHLFGWMGTAIRTGDGEWFGVSVCPRCDALVLSDERHPYGDRRWAHEQWHARTDFPDDVVSR